MKIIILLIKYLLNLLIVADLDEILTREGIQYIKQHPPNNFYFIKGLFLKKREFSIMIPMN